MNVSSIMSGQPRSCRPDENLTRAMQLMWDHDIGFLPVIDGSRRVLGVITDRDIAMCAYFKDRPLREIPVSAAMSKDVTCCRSDESVGIAEGAMKRRQVRRLPVVDAAGLLEGVLSLNDIARAAAHRGKGDGVSTDELASTLGEICEPRKVKQLLRS